MSETNQLPLPCFQCLALEIGLNGALNREEEAGEALPLCLKHVQERDIALSSIDDWADD